MSDLRVETLQGAALRAQLPALAALRIAVFREWPYLYEGSAEAERRYLAAQSEAGDAAMIVAFDGDQAVGAATCLKLAAESDAVKAPFIARGWDLDRFWYFGESVLLPAYRGRGIGVRFFAAREAAAMADPACDFTCFCAVERPADHPARPAGYVPLDSFWRRRGYRRYPDLACTMSWQEIGAQHETSHKLVFWLRAPGGARLP